MWVCVCICMCVDLYVCGSCVMWLLCPWLRAWGPQIQAQVRQFTIWFSIWFSICLAPASPVHPAMIGYLAFAGVQIQGLFPWSSNSPGGTSGTHATCCEEKPVLLWVLPGSRSAACTAHCACIVHRHPGSVRYAYPLEVSRECKFACVCDIMSLVGDQMQ